MADDWEYDVVYAACRYEGNVMAHNGERKRGVPLPSMAALWARRRLVFSLILCLVMALVAAVALRAYGPGNVQDLLGLSGVASPTASPTPALHQVYTFSFDFVPQDSADPMPLHVGQPVTFRWIPGPYFSAGDASPASRPFPVHCTLALYGPYSSLDALTKAMNAAAAAGQGITPPGMPVFTTSPSNMTDWDSTPHQIELVLPATLHAGYYQAGSECLYDRDQGSTGTSIPIQIDT